MKATMNNFIPDGSKRNASSPELKEKIKAKKLELQSLKKRLKTTAATKKKEIETQIKTLIKELKMISPKSETW